MARKIQASKKPVGVKKPRKTKKVVEAVQEVEVPKWFPEVEEPKKTVWQKLKGVFGFN